MLEAYKTEGTGLTGIVTFTFPAPPEVKSPLPAAVLGAGKGHCSPNRQLWSPGGWVEVEALPSHGDKQTPVMFRGEIR